MRASILMQSSDYYCPFAGIAIISLLENNRHLEEITIYFLADNVSPKNIESLKELVRCYNRKIVFLNTKNYNQILTSAGASPVHGSFTTIFKLFSISQIDASVERLIYIDADMVICDKIDDLLCMDLTGYICAMAEECASFDYKKMIGQSDKEHWYNGGLIVFNIPEWKKQNCENRILDLIKTENIKFPVLDQDVLNVLFNQDTLLISSKYNYMYTYELLGLQISNSAFNWTPAFYDNYAEASKNPIIYHCFSYQGLRPWNQNAIYPDALKWDYYLSKTPWKDLNKEEKKTSLSVKISKILKVLLPPKWYAVVHRRAYLGLIKQQVKEWKYEQY